MANVKLSALTASAANLASGDGIVGYQSGTTTDVLFTRAQLGAGITGVVSLGAATGTSLALGGATLGSAALAVTGDIAASGAIYTTRAFNASPPQFSYSSSGTAGLSFTASGSFFVQASAFPASITGAGVLVTSTLAIGFVSASAASSSLDTLFTRKAAANFQVGAADASTSVAQTISFQGIVAGTSNTSGSTATIIGSLSTGSGTSGDIVLKTGGTGAGATVQNAAVTALTIKGGTQRVIAATTIATGGYTVSTLPSGVVGDTAYVTDALGPTFLVAVTGGGAITTPVFYNGSTWVGG